MYKAQLKTFQKKSWRKVYVDLEGKPIQIAAFIWLL
jgi:hypothetical protein